MAREELIQLLIDSNVSRYMEFLRVGNLITNLPKPKEDTLECIPLSRADIFKSKGITLAEKRELVRLIEAILKTSHVEAEGDSRGEASQSDGNARDKTFNELAASCRLSEKIKFLISAAIVTTEDAFHPSSKFDQEFNERSKVFLESIGRYGNQTPFLWPLYGISTLNTTVSNYM